MLDRTVAPEVHMMGRLTLPKPEIEKLPNGIEILHIKGGSQDVNQLCLVWPGGLYDAGNPAIPSIMAAMVREGTKKMSGAEISEAIDFNGAMLKSGCDGHFTTVNLSSLNTKTTNVLPILHDIISEATIPEEQFATFRDIELRNYLLAHSKVMMLCDEALGPLIRGKNHPTIKIWGPDTISEVTLDEVRERYQRTFTASGCKAFLSGNYSDATYDEIRTMLSRLDGQRAPMPLHVVPYQPEAPGFVKVTKADAQQAAVDLALPAPQRSHPDYVPLRFTVMALGGYFGSRLMKNIREDKGYTYGIAAYLIGSLEGSYVIISAQSDKKYVEALIEEVKAELLRMVTEPLGQEELLRLKQHVSSSLMETLDSPFSIMDYYRTINCVGIPEGYFENQVDWVHRIDAETIQAMAKKYLDPDQLRIAVCE